jgi:hypothetical protein
MVKIHHLQDKPPYAMVCISVTKEMGNNQVQFSWEHINQSKIKQKEAAT